jgi:hypothetical protein
MVEKPDYTRIRKELNVDTCTGGICKCLSSVATSVVTNPFLHKKEEGTPSNVRLSLLPIPAFA